MPGTDMLEAARRRIDRSPALSYLNYAKGQALYRLGLRGHRSGATHAALSVEDGVRYIRRVVADYLTYAGRRAGDLAGLRILEVGPGDNLGVALALIGEGARSVTCIDRFRPVRDDHRNLLVYRRLVEQSPPAARARMEAAVDWRASSAGFDPRRIDCRYELAIERAAAELPGGGYDVILSRAVLEHLRHLEAGWRAMVRLLAAGGEMWHKVDYRNHGLFARIHPLHFLTFGERAWELATAPDPTLNRHRLPSYVSLARDTGLKLDCFVTHVLDGEELEPHRRSITHGFDYGDRELELVREIRPHLAPRFRGLSDLDLLVSGVFLICRRDRPSKPRLAVAAAASSPTSAAQTPVARTPVARTPVARTPVPRAHERPIRVGFVVHVMQVAGAERLVEETILRSAGAIDPTVFCLDDVGALGEDLLGRGVPVLRLGRRPGLDWRLPSRLAREIRHRRIDVLHAQQYTPFFYSALAAAMPGSSCRLILTEHGRHYPDVVSARRRWANRLVLAGRADRVTACCEFSRHALIEVDGFPARRVHVLENGVDLALYPPAADRDAARRGLGLDPAARYVAAIGRLHPVKDHAMLLQAFAELSRRRADARLLVVGDGPLRPELEARGEDLGLGAKVRFLGVRRDVAAILGAVDVFALTSRSEAASLTLLEAMASARPVVATNVGGTPEIVRHGIEGFLVPRGDWRCAATALEYLLDHPREARAIGRAARRRVKERYLLGTTVQRYLELYRSVCASGRRAVGR